MAFDIHDIYGVVHSHAHGVSIYHFTAAEEPGEQEVIDALGIDYEPQHGETLEVNVLTPHSFPVIKTITRPRELYAYAIEKSKALKLPGPYAVVSNNADYITLLTDRFGDEITETCINTSLQECMFDQISFVVKNYSHKMGIMIVEEFATLESYEEERPEEIKRQWANAGVLVASNENVIKHLAHKIHSGLATEFPMASFSFNKDSFMGRVEMRAFLPHDTPELQNEVNRLGQAFLDFNIEPESETDSDMDI